MALGNRGMTVEARDNAKEKERVENPVHMYLNEFHTAILLGPMFCK